MAEAKFTKGPWRVLDNTSYDDREYYYQILDKFGQNIANIEDCEDEEEEANAKLISAAPDMFEMLDAIVPILRSVAKVGVAHDGDHVWPETLNGYADIIGKILKKARGEA